MNKIFIVAEVGINSNGDINIAKKLIDGAVFANADMIKFQKRCIDKCYTKEELDKPRESQWGTTNRDQKLGLEFTEKDYDEIDRYCKEKGIIWSASPWDLESVEFLKKYNLKYNKIPSARLRHLKLLEEVAKQKKYTFISTGMSTIKEINDAVLIFKKYDTPFELMHCNSTYPCKDEDLNLSMIPILKHTFNCKVGYSCHSAGLIPPVLAVVLGATSIEKHITLDRTMYGSDQAASMEIYGFYRMIKYIRDTEKSIGEGKKIVTLEEQKIRNKLDKTEDYNENI
jgi:N-acetylneuraminate synthase